MEHSFRLLLWLYKSKLTTKGTAPLLLRITVDSCKTEVFTGITIPPKLWDKKRGTIKGANNEIKELNKRIELLKSKVNKIYNELLELDMPISAEQIKKRLNK